MTKEEINNYTGVPIALIIIGNNVPYPCGIDSIIDVNGKTQVKFLHQSALKSVHSKTKTMEQIQNDSDCYFLVDLDKIKSIERVVY